ncbi:MAG: BatA and WFA domain-containing protein [Lachnospiraceae bacterium]|nr:BatA and WFA domain-containing protein [Lachnospiraceae bacterium]
MSITYWWPLFLLVLIPVIILLYMLKQKAKEYPFSSSMLWKKIMNNIEATTPWEKLKKNLLMFLQILTVLLLVFTLMAPYLKHGGRIYDNVILVIDNSASMGIAYNDDHSRLEEAKKRACDYVDSLSETAQVTILTSAEEAGILKTNATDKTELKKTIKNIPLTDLPGDTTAAVSVSQSMANQWEQYEAVFFTDTPVALGALQARVVNLYTDYRNLSMDYVSYGMDENAYGYLTVLGKITNGSSDAVTTDVNLYGDDVLLQVQNITVPPAESMIVYFNQVNFGGTVLKMEINNPDDLMSDNQAYVTLETQNQKKALLVTNDNLFLEKAITNITWVDLYKTSQPSAIGKDDTYDLYIFDGIVPDTLPEKGNYLYINVDSGDNIESKGSLTNVRLQFDEAEITNYVADYSFGASSAIIYDRPIWANSFITGDNKCVGYFGETDGRRIAVIGFDIHNSDIALQAEFPILMSNLMDYMMVSSLVSGKDYIAGDKISFNGNLNGSAIQVTAPDGAVTSLEAAVMTSAYTDTDQAGVYHVTQSIGGEEKAENFVVGFPVNQESHIDGDIVDDEETEGSDEKNLSGGRDLRNLLIILLLLALAAEWIVYIRQH